MQTARRWTLIVAILGAAFPLAAAQEHRLFDGRTLDGWEGDPRFWRVEDGVLVGESTPDEPCRESTYLTWTGGEPADFDLSLEFRIRNGNSGIQFRSRRLPGFKVAGYQADLDAAGEWTGGFYEQDGRGVIARRGERVRRSDGAAVSWPLGDPRELLGERRDGAWTHYRIRARGPRIELSIDGRRTCALVDEESSFARGAGVLALQLHAGPAMRVEYRNLVLAPAPPWEDAASEDWALPRPALERAPPDVPRWIWSAPSGSEGERAWLFREFDLAAAPERALLSGTCDNRMRVLVNGEDALASTTWERPVRAEVTGLLRKGRNVIAVEARNEGGPAGLELALELDGEHHLVTDASWSAADEAPEGWEDADFDPRGLSAAHELNVLGQGPWGELPAPRAPELDQALPADQVTVAEGYAVERVHSVDKARHGSWVALTFDPRGRAIVSDERGGLHRLTLPSLPDAQPVIETIDSELGGAQGLLALEGVLYVVAHPRGEHSAGLYRFRDVDGDDRFDERELLLPLEGSGEHGPHAVLLEPDGAGLVLLAGNHTRLPEVSSSRVPRVWGEDQLLPRRDDPGGHAVGVMAPGGWVLRTDLDGGDPELIACGMRNAYDMAFGPGGELFAYDSDMEWDVGMGWYRAPRVLHLVSGADFGWRHGSGKWPADWPDTLPSVVDTDLSSPVGVLYGGELSAFGARERRALFIADWAYGRILAVDLEPSGASWTGSVRPFVSGEPLPLTDLAAGPGGELYFTVGGRGTQSGLYRVRRTAGAGDTQDARPVARSDARDLRRSLERFHGRADARALEEASAALDHPDRFVRAAARVALESQPGNDWRARALTQTRPAASVQAALALAHTGVPGFAAATTELLARLPLETLDAPTLVEVLRALALVEVRLGGLPREQRALLVPRLEAMFPSGEDRLDRELCRLLVRLRSEHVLEPALALLERAEGSEEATHYAFCLVELDSGWTSDQVRRYAAWLDRAPERHSGGASLRGYLAGLRADARLRLGIEPAPIEASVPDPESLARPFLHAWSVRELEPRLGSLNAGRSFERGRAMMVAARCGECHSMRGEGGRTGPDLTGVASRLSARDLIEAIVEPSRVVSDQYQDTELLTTGDELLVGRVVGESQGVVRFLTLPPGEELVELDAAQIASRRPHPLSRMPEGLLNSLEEDEVLDLLAFLLARGDPDDPRFAH